MDCLCNDQLNPDKVDMLRTQLTKVRHPEVRGG